MSSKLDARGTGYSRLGNGLNALIVKIPQKHIVGFGKLLGRIAYLLDGSHRRIVRRNLAFAYPAWSRLKIKKTSRHIFQNFGITFFEFFQLAALSKDDILNRTRIIGQENLQCALARKKGLVIVSAHLGNWEMALQYGCCFLQQPILGVAKKIRFAPLNRWVHRLRSRLGNKIIYKKGALTEMRQTLRRGGVLVLLVDQSRRSEGVDVTFFSHKVTATPAAAFLAIRCKSPVLPIFCVRNANGRLTVEVKPPLEMKRTDDFRSDVQTNTQIITDAIEEEVREYPDQWFWMHKRWKKYYPHLYPEYQARRKRRHQRNRRRTPLY